jgi:Protein of unknown function (DUF3562)
MPRSDAATIAALAAQTQIDESVVRSLYEEEFAVLAADSSVKNFISLIAARRVRERLRASRHRPQPAPAPPAGRSRAA